MVPAENHLNSTLHPQIKPIENHLNSTFQCIFGKVDKKKRLSITYGVEIDLMILVSTSQL